MKGHTRTFNMLREYVVTCYRSAWPYLYTLDGLECPIRSFNCNDLEDTASPSPSPTPTPGPVESLLLILNLIGKGKRHFRACIHSRMKIGSCLRPRSDSLYECPAHAASYVLGFVRLTTIPVYITQYVYAHTRVPDGGKLYVSSVYLNYLVIVSPRMDSPAEQPRVTRLHGSACDTCRRRRVKCDGNQPCDRCVRSGVACTYGSVASRTSAVSYARQLEQKVAELQGLLRERPQAESSKTDIEKVGQ